MKKEDYIKTIEVNGTKVDLGVDDYGQCYYIEYKDPTTGEQKEVSLGTYCTEYMEEIYYLLDPVYADLDLRRNRLGENLNNSESSLLSKYNLLFEEEYKDYA